MVAETAHLGSVPIACLALAVSMTTPAAADGLGESRASFMTHIAENCMKHAAADPDAAEVPKATLMSLCRCSAAYIAARITPAQFDKPTSPETRALISEATGACLRRGAREIP